MNPNAANSNNSFTPFLPSTYNVPEEEDRRVEWLGSNLSDISDVVNDKVIGMFLQDSSTFNGHKYFYDTTRKLRNGFRFLLRVKSYPNAGPLVIPLPIIFTPQFIVSQVWGSASKPPILTPVPIPDSGEYFSFYSEGNSRITFVMTERQVTITTTADMTQYSGMIIIDYIKDGQ